MLDNFEQRFHSTEHGSGLYAKRAFKAGDVLLKYPFMASAAVEHAYCSYCLIAKPLKCCSKCKSVFYCSVNCQRTDWTLGHKYLCCSNATRDQEMLIKVLIQLNRNESDGNKKLFLNLIHHLEKIEPDVKQEWLKSVEKVQKLVPSNFTESIDCLKVFAVFYSNNFAIHNSEMWSIGETCCPVGSLLNHSCDPNVSVQFESRNIVLRALKDIQKDEQLTNSYLDPILSREKRQEKLLKRYFFECNCFKCQDNSVYSVDSILAKKHPEISDFDQVDHHPMDTLKSSVLELVQNVNSKSKYLRILKSSNIIGMDVFEKAVASMDSCLEANDFKAAINPSMYILCIYLLTYSTYHPLLTLHASLVAKILWNACELKTARVVSEFAVDAVAKSHGESALLQDTKHILDLQN